ALESSSKRSSCSIAALRSIPLLHPPRRCGGGPRWGRIESLKITRLVHDLAADHREERLDFPYFPFRHAEVIVIQDQKIGQFAAFQRTEKILASHVFSRPIGRHLERADTVDALAAVVNFSFDFTIDQNVDVMKDGSYFKDFVVIEL